MLFVDIRIDVEFEMSFVDMIDVEFKEQLYPRRFKMILVLWSKCR